MEPSEENRDLPSLDSQPEPLPELEPVTEAAAEPLAEPLRLRRIRRQRRREWRFGQAFWTVSSILSLVTNIILVVALIGLGRQLFTLKSIIEKQVLGGLYENFILMDEAHIRTTIPVSTQVPAKFDLPLKTDTQVILTEDTILQNATVASLSTGGLTITNAPATIVLPRGTVLPVALELTVPVDQMIPVNLNVSVDIPLKQTDLHEPFVGLQEVVRPYYRMMADLPDNWNELLCGPQAVPLCGWIFKP